MMFYSHNGEPQSSENLTAMERALPWKRSPSEDEEAEDCHGDLMRFDDAMEEEHEEPRPLTKVHSLTDMEQMRRVANQRSASTSNLPWRDYRPRLPSFGNIPVDRTSTEGSPTPFLAGYHRHSFISTTNHSTLSHHTSTEFPHHVQPLQPQMYFTKTSHHLSPVVLPIEAMDVDDSSAETPSRTLGERVQAWLQRMDTAAEVVENPGGSSTSQYSAEVLEEDEEDFGCDARDFAKRVCQSRPSTSQESLNQSLSKLSIDNRQFQNSSAAVTQPSGDTDQPVPSIHVVC